MSTRTPAILSEVFRDFPQFLYAEAGIILLHSKTFEFFIINLSSYHPTLHILDTESIVTQPTEKERRKLQQDVDFWLIK